MNLRCSVTLSVAAGLFAAGGPAYAQATCSSAPLPAVTLTPGEFYFRVDDKPTLLLGTNPYAQTAADFSPLLAGAGVNEKVVRLFVHSLPQSPATAGAVDEAWATQWDTVLCDAQANGLYALLVLDVWPNWNDAAVPTLWASSIYNSANGGPASVTSVPARGAASGVTAQ